MTKFVIRIPKRFDFNEHPTFRAAIRDAIESKAEIIEVDFLECQYMDSAALGMLLVLRDRVKASKQKVQLAFVHGEVARIFDIANFSRIFTFV